MKKIRIGNDIYVAWQIFGQDGVPYNLVGKSLVLDMRVHNPESSTGETVIPVTNFSVTYNTLYFTFWGVNQTLQGLYILKLRENIEGGGQKTLDTKEAFTLVGHTWDQSDDDSGLLISMTSFVGVGLRGEKGDKGDQGDKGDTGDPGIETASVTVDATTGTPSATATITNKNLALSFSGIKGEQGIQGVQGPKGDQGNTGSSVDYPYELVNNLTTDDSTKGLTAAMGKQIGDNISQLAQEVDDITTDPGTPIIAETTSTGWRLMGNGLCATDANAQMKKYLVTAGQTIYLKLSADNPGVYQFQSSASVPASGTNANLIGLPVTTAVDGFVKVPSGATYLIISENTGNTYNEVKTTISYSFAEQEERISVLEDTIEGGVSPVELSGYAQTNGAINAGKWAGCTSTSYKHLFLPVNPGDSYRITANGVGNSIIAAFSQQDISPSNGDTPSFVDGFGEVTITTNTSKYITIPKGCAYLFVMTLWNGADRLPVIEKTIIPIISSVYEDKLGTEKQIFTAICPDKNGVINNGLWAGTAATNYLHIFYPVSPGEKYKITANNSNSANFAPFSQLDKSPSNGDTPSITPGYSVVIVPPNQSAVFDVPTGCAYLYVVTQWNGTDRLPIIKQIIEGKYEQDINETKEDVSTLVGRLDGQDHLFLNSYFVGNGNTYAKRIIYGLKPGYTYRVIIRKTSWDTTGVTSVSVNGFGVYSYHGTVATALVTANINSQGVFPTINDFYEFKVPSDSDNIQIGGRATEGERVDFMLVYNSLVPIVKNSFNSQLHDGLTDWQSPCRRFAALMQGDSVNAVPAVDKCDSFLFFTDPHTQHIDANWNSHFEEYLSQIQKVYNSTPTDFVLCGGDWLGNSDTPDVAAFKLGLISKSCYTMMPKCYLLVGNHDTNYQGKKDAGAANYTTRLPDDAIRNLWYYWNKKRAYFTIDGRNTRFYCFDTGVENQTLAAYDNYGYEQAEWFAQSLLSETFEHIAIGLHIYRPSNNSESLQPLASLVMQIAVAYNSRSTIAVSGHNYNFSGATGRVEFAIAGHQHMDAVYTYTDGAVSIPVIVTTDTGYGTTFPVDASFDLVFVDYDNRKITCVRVGSGSDREINLDVE